MERSSKRLRVYLAGRLVAETLAPLLVWEVPYYPTYYFPLSDIRARLVEEPGVISHSPSRGDARTFALELDEARAPAAALRYDSSPIEELRDAVRIAWDSMDAWFEEDQQVYTHARDPYTRVDVLAGSRHVQVILQGQTIADSDRPTLLFETGLPPRFYLPRPDVRMDLLELSQTITHCPYKGQAQSFNVRVGDLLGEDLAWSYPAPFAESQKIAGLIAFYNEKLDIVLDGTLQERPVTKFS